MQMNRGWDKTSCVTPDLNLSTGGIILLFRLLKNQPFKIGALSLGVIAVLIAIPVVANQLEQVFDEDVIGDFKHIKTEHDAKHTPKIECPGEVRAGEWFDVTVTIGADAIHPTLYEHYVNWIAIYKNDVELARAYLHPIHTMPKVTFTIALEESTTLVAMEQPNHTAPWKASKEIKVVKK
jgi:superoxide reductase